MAAKKLMTVYEALEHLENLDVSEEDDLPDDEDFISRGRLVILPPKDEGDRDINENWGDKNEVFANILNGSQLLAGATADLSALSGNISLGAGDEEEIVCPSFDVPSKLNKRSKVNVSCVSLTSCWCDTAQNFSHFLTWLLALLL